MVLKAALFYGLQILCPLLGCILAYLYAYSRRLKGDPGRELEVGIALHGSLTAAVLSLFFFWGWPAGGGQYHEMPGLHLIATLVLGTSPADHADAGLLKLMLSVAFAAAAALVAKLFAGPLNRHLVRRVPRFFPATKGFRRR